MTRMGRFAGILTIVAGLAVAALMPASADAYEGRRAGYSTSGPSVFPQPRDPWRSWGVRSEVPKHVGAPNYGPQNLFWVPGHWFWDGATWVWWPGHWAAR